ncbi:MAG: hypothetical protein V5A27_02120 [Halapricum sp.]
MSELVGLNELANNPNLTFIAFIAFVQIATLGVRFGLYAYWNGRASSDDAQTVLWGYLLLVGLAAAGYGLVGIGRIVLFADWLLELTTGFALLLVLLVALTLREIEYTSTFTGETDVDPSQADTAITAAFLLAVVIVTIGLLALPDRRQAMAGLVGLAGVVFFLYGYRYGSRHLERTRIQGTLLDTLLRHLLPVLVFGSLIPIVELATVAGLDRIIVLHVQIVLVIMTAMMLMTSTIKLRQNLSGLRG